MARDQLRGNWLGEREADGGLLNLVSCELVLKLREESRAGGVERVMPFPGGKIEDGDAVQFIRGDLIGDHFLGGGQGFADGGANALENGLNVPAGSEAMYSATEL